MKNQPANTKVTTQHTINYKGNLILIKGQHERKFSKNSQLSFSIYCGNRGMTFGDKGVKSLRQMLDCLLASISEANLHKVKADAFFALHQSLSTYEKIEHSNFAYARFQPNSDGNYYNIYWKSELSPNGIELVGGCSETEWEIISKATGKSHNYLSPTEGRVIPVTAW